jgi:plastocyanin
MTTLTSISSAPPPRPRFSPRRMVVLGGMGFLLLGTLIFASTPIAQRLWANPTGTAPAVGVTEVIVRADSTQNHLFDPPVIEVPVGSEITWTFADYGITGDGEAVPHNVVGEGFESPLLGTGTFTHQFDTPGSYLYRCTLHAFMEGRVIVTTPES